MKPKIRLGILASHPIQYQAPFFKALARELDLQVFFAHRQTPQGQASAGFGAAFEWDVDLLSGYQNCFLENKAKRPSTNRFFGCDTPKIRERILWGNFDCFLVMGWNLLSYWQAVWACKRFGIPVFARGDSQLATRRHWIFKAVKKIVYPPLLRNFDGYLAVGKNSKAYYLHYGVDPKKLFFVPHCVDNHFFKKGSDLSMDSRNRMRRELGISEDAVVALFVGKLIPMKRPVDILKAVPLAGEKRVEVLFVGSGELEMSLRTCAQALNVKTHLVGFKNQSELPPYYAVSDFIILPSSPAETWGLVINEAMACGLPAIVSDKVGCAPDLVEQGVTGFVYLVGDVAGLAAAIKKLVEAPPASLRAAVAKKIDGYSIQEAVKNTVSALESLTPGAWREKS